MTAGKKDLLAKLPSIDTLLKDDRIVTMELSVSRKTVVWAMRAGIDHIRQKIIAGTISESDKYSVTELVIEKVQTEIEQMTACHYRKAINATGIILHTALGRAALAPEAIEQIHRELSGYSVLQIDPKTGKRSRRDEHIESLLKLLAGAEAATIVNNNAAATAITLNTVARGKEVIVSRGQLVEIGGSFRLPDVMAFSGAKMVEVGTTNKTHLRDYETAITEDTAAIIRVHPSNYRIQGFSSEVDTEALAELAHKHGLVMIDDVGAGSLIDMSHFGFEPEPTLVESLSKGADIVTSSGDKMLGGPQAGIILGKTEYIEAIRKNQFARIVRVDKFTLCAMEATLKLFLDESQALRKIPILRMALKEITEIEKTVSIMIERLEGISESEFSAMKGFSQMGSGSLPTQEVPTVLLAVDPLIMTAENLASQLRMRNIPIFARIQNEQVLFDPRTLKDGEEDILIEALYDILKN